MNIDVTIRILGIGPNTDKYYICLMVFKLDPLHNIYYHFYCKHDLARSCFPLWPIIGDEGDRVTGEVIAKTIIFEIRGGFPKIFHPKLVFGSLFGPNELLILHLALFLDQLSALGQNQFQQYSPFILTKHSFQIKKHKCENFDPFLSPSGDLGIGLV